MSPTSRDAGRLVAPKPLRVVVKRRFDCVPGARSPRPPSARVPRRAHHLPEPCRLESPEGRAAAHELEEVVERAQIEREQVDEGREGVDTTVEQRARREGLVACPVDARQEGDEGGEEPLRVGHARDGGRERVVGLGGGRERRRGGHARRGHRKKHRRARRRRREIDRLELAELRQLLDGRRTRVRARGLARRGRLAFAALGSAGTTGGRGSLRNESSDGLDGVRAALALGRLDVREVVRSERSRPVDARELFVRDRAAPEPVFRCTGPTSV